MGDRSLLATNQWAENSTKFDDTVLEEDHKWNFITCYVALGILAHSFCLHGRKYDSVRVCTDFACILGILSAVSTTVIRILPKNLLSSVLINQVINYAICSALIKVCDMQMFFSRYCVIQRVRLESRMMHYMVWFLIYAVLISMVTIGPIFADINSPYYSGVYLANEASALVAVILYELYFTVMSVRFIFSLARWERHQKNRITASPMRSAIFADSSTAPNIGSGARLRGVGSISNSDPMIKNLPPQWSVGRGMNLAGSLVSGSGDRTQTQQEGTDMQSDVWRWRLKIVAYKSVIHAVISIFGFIGIVAIGHDFARTVAIQTVITMHVLFNWRIEYIIWPSKSDIQDITKNRGIRELNAILQLRRGVGLIRRMESSGKNNNDGGAGDEEHAPVAPSLEVPVAAKVSADDAGIVENDVGTAREAALVCLPKASVHARRDP